MTTSPLAILKEGAEEEVTRWVDALDPDPSIDAPAFRVLVAYLPEDEFDRLSKSFRKLKRQPDGTWVDALNISSPEQLEKFNSLILYKIARDWTGLTRVNLIRGCEMAMTRPSLSKQLPDEIPFSEPMARELGRYLNGDSMTRCLLGARDLQAFAAAGIEREKNDETSG